MKKTILIIIFTIGYIVVSNKPLHAQYVLKEADKQFELYNYIKAIDLYEKAYKKKESLHAAERLGDAYRLINNYKQAESWYAIASKMPNSKVDNTLYYAKALQNNSKFAEAKIQYQDYITKNTEINTALQNIWIASCDSAVKWMANPKKLEILNQKKLNSDQSDWGAVNYADAVVFASDRKNVSVEKVRGNRPFLKFDDSNFPDKNIYGWTGNGYLRLYIKQNQSDSISLFPIKTGTDYHVGATSFTADGKTMYFTLTRIPSHIAKVKGQPSTINVEIFSSTKNESGVWSTPVAFAYNNVNKYSVGDPFISGDGESLYFSSNMPGGRGGTDIYYCLKTAKGDWAKPINLKEVNTEGNERSPVIDQHNNFYFSSDGYVGMGGLDVFRAIRENGQIGRIENMGYPFNSPQDDFGFSLNANGNIVYLSSSRTEGVGSDDIYSLNEKNSIAFKLNGIVYDKSTNEPLKNALVTLKNNNGSILKVQADGDGKFKFDLDTESHYTLIGGKTGFRNNVSKLATTGLKTSTTITKNLYLEPIKLNQAIRIENIYYDFDKWNIRPDAAIELDKLVTILEENPTIWIELGSHTDSRGQDAYNLSLSQKRAESAVQYIISRGIDANRITAKGYGETQLLNRCSNGVQCTEAEHQLNRRTEFKIVKL